MKVKILLFAQLKEAYGAGEFFLDVPPSVTVQDTVNCVLAEASLSPFKNLPLRFAVNEEFKQGNQVLNENDSLAFLSPVAGG